MKSKVKTGLLVSAAVLALGIVGTCVLHGLGVIYVPWLWKTFRSPTTYIIPGSRIYEDAIDQWAIENNKINKETFDFSDVSDYIRATTARARTSEPGTDKPETTPEPKVVEDTQAAP